MNIQEIYFKSDFTVILASEAQWGGCPFRLSFYTASPSRSFVACFDGENYHNCRLLTDGRLEIGINQKDGNVQSLMGIGKLMLAPEFYLDNDAFRDHVCNQFVKPFVPTFVKKDEDGNDVEYQVALSLNGASTFTTIGTLPAYYQAGLTPEEHQALLDATRDANAAATNADDTAEDVKSDVRDFLAIEGKNVRDAIELVQKTGVAIKAIGDEAKANGDYAKQMADKASASGDKANAFAEKAGAKADLADIKAKLADEKAQLADTKANLANSAATSANNAAQTAQQATTAANTTAQRVDREWIAKSEEWNDQISTAVFTSSQISAKAEKVNAELDGSVVTVTNRNGQSKSIDLKDATYESRLSAVEQKGQTQDTKLTELSRKVGELDKNTKPIISAVEKLDWKVEKSYNFDGVSTKASLNTPITLTKDGDSIEFGAETDISGFGNGYGLFAHKNASNQWRGIGVDKDGVRIRFADGSWFNSSNTIKCNISNISISYENGNVILRSNGNVVYTMSGQKDLTISVIGYDSVAARWWNGSIKDLKVNGEDYVIEDNSTDSTIVVEKHQDSSFLTEEEKKKIDAITAGMYVEKSATQMNIYFRKADGTYIGYPLIKMSASGMFYDYWATRQVFVAQYANGKMNRGENLLYTSEAELAMYIGLSDGTKNYVGGQMHGFENIAGSIQAGGDGSNREIVIIVDGKHVSESEMISLKSSNRVEVYQHTYLYPCSSTASPFAEVSKNWVFEDSKMVVSTSIKMLTSTKFYNIFFGMLGVYRHWMGDATKPYLTSRAVKCNKPSQIFNIEDGWYDKDLFNLDKECKSLLALGECGYSFKLTIEDSNLTNGGFMIRTNNNPYNKIYYGMESADGLDYSGEWRATQIWHIN